MSLIESLSKRWEDQNQDFLIHPKKNLKFKDILNNNDVDISKVKSGDVVALIGDFDPLSIATLLNLVDKKVILVPLTNLTKDQHNYFFESAFVNVVIEGGKVLRMDEQQPNKYLDKLRSLKHSGLVLFSTGTTGRPKAILHDFEPFLERFNTQRPTLRTLNFLLFDHIGGLNTLFHTLFNRGVVIAPEERSISHILDICKAHNVEAMPTTPTFLRMLLMSGEIPEKFPKSVKIVTYGTERMDQPTLDALCDILPDVDFRQTFGMSELGILRVKSESRDSLYMKIGGEGVEYKVIDDILFIRSKTRMIGYLNAASPFDEEGWYNTKDIVEVKDDMIKVTGRTTEVINVGGLKFMASEVERVALDYTGVKFVKVFPKQNPITGEHSEMDIQLIDEQFDIKLYKKFLNDNLQSHMVPRRIHIKNLSIGHRFKKL